jgi:glycine hydroxymethyltransferase
MTNLHKRNLQNQDPELFSILNDETKRQNKGIELIASENFTSNSVLECLGSIFTNKYSEGLPGKRYYGGNEHIDRLENLCIKRALKAFRLNDNEWGCNVQPYSGSVANLAVYLALLKPGDTIMGLELSSGGHLTHGFYTPKKKITASSTYYNSVPYKVNEYGFIDYLKLEQLADEHKPKLIICGASAYSRDFDYENFRKIANKHNSYLMADIAHISGFVATGEMNNPFEYCDIVTTTTHKTLRGPRAGMIFFKKNLEQQINDAVFPGLQGGPHQNQIAGIACQLNEVMTPEFKKYIQQVRSNAQTMCEEFRNRNYDIVTGGTDNHLFLLNLKNKGISGARAEKTLEYVDIYINKNTVPGDVSALNPSGIRIGTPAMTTKGMKEKDMKKIVEFIDEALTVSVDIQKEHEPKTLKEFVELLKKNSKINTVKNNVRNWINETDELLIENFYN